MAASPADSLSQPDPSEDASDFADAGEELPGGDSNSNSDDGSDFEAGSGSRKRKAGKPSGAQKSKRKRPENDMVKKLRSRVPEDGQEVEGDAASADAEKAGTPDEAVDDFVEPVAATIERHRTVEEEHEERQQLRSNWELAAIFSFLEAFGPHLRLISSFTASELEHSLIVSDGQAGLLAELHKALLQGINPRTNFAQGGGWQGALAGKLRYQWRTRLLADPPAFVPEKGQEAATYASLDTAGRVSTLKTLCEMRLDCLDLINLVEECGKVGRSAKANAVAAANAKRKGPPLPEYVNIRPAPLGTSGKGHSFWLLDLHSLQEVRLYQEVPSTISAKADKGQGTGARRKEPKPSRFEQVASTADEFQQIGEQLSRSRAKADKQISSKILDSIVPELVARQEEEDKRQKAAAKLRLQLDSIIPDDQGGFGRSRRARKAVNYTFDAFDAEIKRAIRSDGQRQENGWPEMRPRRGQPEPPALPKLSRAERAARRGGPEAAAEAEALVDEAVEEDDDGAPRYRPLGQLLEDPEPSATDAGDQEEDDAAAQQDSYYNMGAYSREDTPEGLYEDEEDEGPEPSASDPSFAPSEPSSNPVGPSQPQPVQPHYQQSRLQPKQQPPQQPSQQPPASRQQNMSLPSHSRPLQNSAQGQQNAAQDHIKVVLRPGGQNAVPSGVQNHSQGFSHLGLQQQYATGLPHESSLQQQYARGLPHQSGAGLAGLSNSGYGAAHALGSHPSSHYPPSVGLHDSPGLQGLAGQLQARAPQYQQYPASHLPSLHQQPSHQLGAYPAPMPNSLNSFPQYRAAQLQQGALLGSPQGYSQYSAPLHGMNNTISSGWNGHHISRGHASHGVPGRSPQPGQSSSMQAGNHMGNANGPSSRQGL